MQEWLQWARGPLFRFAFLLMLLGLARLVALNVFALWDARRRAGEHRVPMWQLLRETATWLVPFQKVPTRKSLFVGASMTFHAAIIVTPILLGAHILLWKRGLGIAWPSLGQHASDVLTLVGLCAGLLLLWERIFRHTARALSRPQDYLLLALLLGTLLSGYLAMHPHINPFAYDATMLVHVLTGNATFVALPFSKLSHAILFPFNQVVSEMGWHLVPGAGRRVALALGKENDSV